MGPLSGKQHREYLKFQNKEAREKAKMELDESRKQQLHEIKLQEAAAKANQNIGHKELVNNAKLKDMGIPKPKTINREKLGMPSLNPMAGTGMFHRGQHMLAQGTDTVPAMLTPGEAVIPAPAAQNPKNKKAIQRMVQEGRKANALRDGAVDVRYSDAPAQAKYHADGSINIKESHEGLFTKKAQAAGMSVQEFASKVLSAPEGKYDASTRKQANFAKNASHWHADGATEIVPSLAYRHPDVPGSSFEDGTERVYNFKRGSAQQANYADGTEHVFSRGSPDMQHYNSGTYGVVPQQVQQAVGYAAGTVDVQNLLAIIPKVGPTKRKIKGYFNGETEVPNPEDEEKKKQQSNVIPMVVADAPPNEVGTSPEAPANLVVPQVTQTEIAKPAVVAQQPAVQPVQTVQPVVAPLAVPVNQMNTDQLAERDKVNIQNTPAVNVVPPKEDLYSPETATRRADFEPTKGLITDPAKASARVRSVSDIVQELTGTAKDEKSLTDSLANLFTAKGFKEELGLNNQDIIRMAISTVVGAKRYGAQRALAYAGRQAFEESSKRQAQQQADQRAIRSAAVALHGQELSAAKAEDREDARNKERIAVTIEANRKEERRYAENLNREARAELRQDANRYEDAMARDFGPRRADVINKATAIVNGKEPAKDANEYSQRLQAATRFLNANVYHHHAPDRDPNAWKPKWEDTYTTGGVHTRAAQTPEGNWLVSSVTPEGKTETKMVPGQQLLSHGAYNQRIQEVKESVKAFLPSVQPSAMNKKKSDLVQGDMIDADKLSRVGVMLQQQFPQLNPTQFGKAFETTVTSIAQDGKQFNSDAIQHAFTTKAIIELNPTDRSLFRTDNKGSMPKGEAMVEFGNAVDAIKKDANVSDDQAYNMVKKSWEKLSTADQQKIANLSRVTNGYSPMMEFGIDLTRPADQRKFKFLDKK